MLTKLIDLVIVRPTDRSKAYGQLSTSTSAIEPPLWAALIAAYVRENGYSVRVIDTEAEDFGPDDVVAEISDYDPLLIVFAVTGSNLSASTWHMTGTRDYITAFKEKRPHVKTLLWGLHPSALPERTLREEGTDFVCQGEGFITLVDLLGLLKNNAGTSQYDNIPGLWYFANGKIRSSQRAQLIENLDELPNPAWGLLPMDRYRAHNWHCFDDISSRVPYGVIYTSLGCPFDCSFCNLRVLFGSPGIRFRSPQKVLEDIDILVKQYHVRNIKVLDECFVLRESHVLKICDLIIKRGYDLNIWAYARIDTVNQKMLSKLRQAGFHWLCYGIESADRGVRNGVAKRGFDKHDIEKTIEMTRATGISVVANFMFGLPDDNFKTMRDTLNLAKELNCEYNNFYSTKAYPGSELYQEAVRDGVRLPETWRGYAEYSYDCLPLPTKYLSGEDVLRFRDEAFIEFYSNPKYLEMINERFGQTAVDHIRSALNHKLPRQHA